MEKTLGLRDLRLENVSIYFHEARYPIYVYVIAAVTAYYFLLTFYRLTFHPFAKYPGPFLAKISPIFYAWAFCRGRGGPEIREQHEKYGPIIRIGPNELSFATVQAYRDIYNRYPGRKFFVKTKFYEHIASGYGHVGFPSETDPEVHAKQRKLYAPVFSAQGVRAYEHLFLKNLENFLTGLGKIGNAPKGVDFEEGLHAFLYDMTSDLSLGEAITDGKQGANYWMRLVNDNINIFTYVDCLSRFTGFGTLNFLIETFAPKHVLHAREHHVKLSYEAVARRLKDKKREGRPDMLTYLMEHDNAKGVPLDRINADLSLVILAGGSTTAIVVGAMVYFLTLNPHMKQKLRDEVCHLFANSDEINALKLAKCEYLAAVIKEGMRLMPPAPTGLPRYSPGETVDGHYIPKGYQVFVHPWTMCRTTRYWKDPLKFNPERWIDPESTDVKEAAQPFSLGPRQCIGQNLAWDQMRVLITKIFYLFDIELVDAPEDWPVECGTYFTWNTTPLPVRVRPRKEALNDPFFERNPEAKVGAMGTEGV